MPFGFKRRFGKREMHKITCSECGKEAEVPFRPKKGLPVYCQECFLRKRGISPRKREKTFEEEPTEETEETDEEIEEEED